MEFFTYLSRSFLILFLFLITYQLFLRNDAHYKAIRFFLLLGLLAALFLPLAKVEYTVVLESVLPNDAFEQVPVSEGAVAIATPANVQSVDWIALGLSFYLLVTAFFAIRIVVMFIKMLLLIRASQRMIYRNIVVCVHSKVEMPFVFCNRLFVKHEKYLNPQYDEIINHEQVHLYQHHWIDVVVSELFIVFQWFNPFAWYYARLIKQNLEFLADQGVLERGHKYEDYIQTIICETMGAEASVLANHFRFSQNKRRLKMMKNDRKSKWRLLKLLLVLPLVGGLLWAFSEPVYEYRANPEEINDATIQDEKEKFMITGYVGVTDTVNVLNRQTNSYELKIVEGANPLPGTSIVIKGTTIGTVANMQGEFELPVSLGDEIVFSFVGFETKVVKVMDKNSIDVVLKTSAYQLNPTAYRVKYKGKMTPPPPPVSAKKKDVAPPPPPPPVEDGQPVFYVVEELPSYKGDMDGYFANLYTRIEQEKENVDLSGTVQVQFTVGHKGGVAQIKALERWDDKEAAVAVKIVSELKDWKPGVQRGKSVSTTLVVPVEFD